MTSGEADRERLARDRAADFVARLGSDAASEADWLELESWLAEHPAHLAAYDRAERLWAELDENASDILRSLPNETSGVADLTARRERGVSRRWIVAGAVAAAAAAVVIVVGPLSGAKTESYATGPGETRLITLNDGTRINLNGGSRLTVQMSRGERRVQMANAEAAFDVAHAANRPFIVEVGDREVRVVGTEFNISRREPQTTVTVRRGVVEVLATTEDRAIDRLTAGRQLTAVDKGPAQVAPVDPEQAFAWREGRLIYQDRPLTDVAADLSRRFATPVFIAADASKLRFTGVIVLDSEDAVIRRLEALAPVVADRWPDRITLRSRN